MNDYDLDSYPRVPIRLEAIKAELASQRSEQRFGSQVVDDAQKIFKDDNFKPALSESQIIRVASDFSSMR